MQKSEEINELAAALAVAQGQIENALKDSANPFFKSKYADLASVWDAVRKPLAANGLSVLQFPSAEGPKVTVTTTLAHKSGQWVESALTVTAKEDSPQAVGSAITYARRYALQSVCGVAPEDDDGEGAQGRNTQAGRNVRPQQTPQQEKPWLEQFKVMHDLIGPDEYFRILNENHYESAKEIATSKVAQTVLAEMAKSEKKGQAA